MDVSLYSKRYGYFVCLIPNSQKVKNCVMYMYAQYYQMPYIIPQHGGIATCTWQIFKHMLLTVQGEITVQGENWKKNPLEQYEH